MNNKRNIVFGLLSLLVVVSVGYALFSETVTIGGTAKAEGNLSIVFEKVGTIKEVGSKGSGASILDAGKTLSITIPNLEYPTSYVEIPVTIKNNGTIDGVLKGITTEGLTDSSIKVTYSGEGVKENSLLKVNESKEMVIKAEWSKDSNSVVKGHKFNIKLNYEQAPNGAPNEGNPGVIVKDTIPEGAKYYRGVTSNELGVYTNAQGTVPEEIKGKFPEPQDGDVFVYGDYEYRYNRVFGYAEAEPKKHNDLKWMNNDGLPDGVDLTGWGVSVKNGAEGKELYDSPLKSINNKKVEYYICTYAFTNIKSIENLSLNNMVMAFTFCTNLTSVTIPKDTIKIVDSTFAGCINLTSVIIPKSVISIGFASFGNCISLTNITIPSSIVSIGQQAFSNCTSLTNIIIPESVTSIELGAFDGCNNLTIHGKTGSYAETYAKENNIPFVSI